MKKRADNINKDSTHPGHCLFLTAAVWQTVQDNKNKSQKILVVCVHMNPWEMNNSFEPNGRKNSRIHEA